VERNICLEAWHLLLVGRQGGRDLLSGFLGTLDSRRRPADQL
jgi:hypothetical protein